MWKLYKQLSERLSQINFQLIWPGFKRYRFAIYTSEKVQFEDREIPWNEQFIGNTSIYYDGSYIAIWDVEHDFMNNYTGDIDILAANIVHEMFHAYQKENGEQRWPKDLVALKYPNNVENFNLKYEENKLLVDTFEEQELEVKKILFSSFCGIRKQRESLIGTMCECEYLVETAEGMAEYAGTLALKMLSGPKYTNRVMTYVKLLRDFSAIHLNIRKISYYSGAILLLTARNMNIDIIHSISNENRTVFRIISQFFHPSLPENLHYEHKIKMVMEENRESNMKEIEQFLEDKKLKQNGDFYISGYDPMNMFRLDNYILCKTFVRLTDKSNNESISLIGKTLLEMRLESVNQVSGYYR